ncbi:hypothetical protein D6745_02775 [Candidatus Woesearchaeota archaeon]|nr:MAG: hypothetical protein D6745_02775 [Candidatus Woesearchaeota archaeon]
MVSTFRGVIEFFGDIGIYDVVLPFLLVFTLIYAILEKSKVLGTEEIDGKVYTRRNLNSAVAFVIAFFVVASARIVSIINVALANIVLLLIVSFSFILLIGVFWSGEKEVVLKGGWFTFFMVLSFIGVVLIFLHAIGWLQAVWEWVVYGWSSAVVGSIILLIVIVAFMYFITKEPSKKGSGGE